MKNKKMIIFVGLAFLVIGTVLFVLQKPKKEEIVINDDGLLSETEATSLLNDTVRNVITIYEKPDEVFNVEKLYDIVIDENTLMTEELTEQIIKNDSYIKVLNYEEKINSIFSKSGIEQLENTKFGDSSFFVREDDSILFYTKIPDSNKYINSTISIDNIVIEKERIKAVVKLTSYSLEQEDDSVLSFYVVLKDIELVKENDIWLVNDFLYSN